MWTYFDIGRTRDGEDLVSLCEEPGKGDLARCGVMALSYFCECIDHFQDVGKILLGEPNCRVSTHESGKNLRKAHLGNSP